MINNIVDWISHIGQHQGPPRKEERFPIWWIIDHATHKPAMGTEISTEGLVLEMQERPPEKEFNLVLYLGQQKIPVRVKLVREAVATGEKGPVHRITASFIGISADHWDAVVRYIEDVPEPTNKAHAELEAIWKKPDDAYRLLPLAVQDKIVQQLIAQGRLEPTPDGAQPALRLQYLGASKRSDGSSVHRVNIHSRKVIDDKWCSFDTQFTIDAAGNTKQVG